MPKRRYEAFVFVFVFFLLLQRLARVNMGYILFRDYSVECGKHDQWDENELAILWRSFPHRRCKHQRTHHILRNINGLSHLDISVENSFSYYPNTHIPTQDTQYSSVSTLFKFTFYTGGAGDQHGTDNIMTKMTSHC